MNLEKIAVKIRPRYSWEAIDLGFMLTRKFWRSVYLPWLFIFLPIVLLSSWALSGWPVFFTVLFIWWLKPLYDRFLLQIYSRVLFNDIPTAEQSIKALPRLLKSQLVSGLSLHRLVLTRSFYLPVTQLESLKGKARSQRCRILSLRASSHAMWLTIICWCFEWVVCATFIGFAYLMLPESYQTSMADFIFLENNHFSQQYIFTALYALAVFFIEPFYVAAGFMLYINRRTHLEAWDLELSFKKLSQRIDGLIKGTGVAILTIAFTLSLTVSTPAHAESGSIPEEPIASELIANEESGAVIESIMQREEFGKEVSKKYLKYIGDNVDADDVDKQDKFNFDALSDFAVYFAQLFKVLLALFLIAVITMIFINREKWLPLLGISLKPAGETDAVESLFGMDVRPDSLPDNIALSARRLAEKNDLRGALSLLYRGLLSVLINRDELDINQAHTESEIRALAETRIATSRKHYLAELTNAWIMTAYGTQSSSIKTIFSLCDRWSSFEIKS